MNAPESLEFITERALVLRVEDGIAWVRCESQAGCARCAAGQGCGGGLFARLLRGRLQQLPVRCEMPVQPGDQVMIGLRTSAVQNASLLLYGLPLAGLMLGAILAGLLGGGDLAVLTGLTAGLVLGLLLVRHLTARSHANVALQPVLLRRLHENEPCPGVLQARQ